MAKKLSTGLRNGLLVTGHWKTLFTNAVLEIYSGAQPADADQAEAGVKLLRITVGSGVFAGGAPGNGLNFHTTPADGVLPKAPAEVWSGVGLANGVAGWFRLYGNAYVTGASVVGIRLDGSVGTSGSQLNMSTTNIVIGATTTIDSFSISIAA
jgi:hypothetical protein